MSTEILIHISASSRVQDDSRYRKQAEGYLGFRATRRHDLGSKINASPDEPQADGQPTVLPAAKIKEIEDDATTTDGSSSSSSQDATKADGGTANPINSIAEVIFDNRPFSRLDLTPAESRSYLSALVANGNSKTPTVYIERTPIIHRPRTTAMQASPAAKVNQHQRDSWQTLPSVVPDSQPSQNSLKCNQLLAASFFSNTQSASSLAKRQRLDRLPSSNPPGRPGSALPHGPTSSKQEHIGSQVEPPSFPWSDLASQPPIAQIRPPPPETSMAVFDTHVTPTLTLLESQLPIWKTFHPSHTARPLRILERGYWQLKISNDWSPELRRKLWSCLEDLIGKGKAGWGVWCEKYANRPEKASGGENLEGAISNKAIEKNKVHEGGRQGFSPANELVRVYCWGELVPYVYLVLFVASDRMINRQGATWVDAGGEEVVQIAGTAL